MLLHIKQAHTGSVIVDYVAQVGLCTSVFRQSDILLKVSAVT